MVPVAPSVLIQGAHPAPGQPDGVQGRKDDCLLIPRTEPGRRQDYASKGSFGLPNADESGGCQLSSLALLPVAEQVGCRIERRCQRLRRRASGAVQAQGSDGLRRMEDPESTVERRELKSFTVSRRTSSRRRRFTAEVNGASAWNSAPTSASSPLRACSRTASTGRSTACTKATCQRCRRSSPTRRPCRPVAPMA